MPTTPVRGTLPLFPQDACAELVEAGSVLTLPGPPLQRLLVGRLRWASDSLLLAFPAFGERPDDVRIVRFKTAQQHVGGISFFDGDELRAKLTPIAISGVDDPEDYLVAWSMWAEMWPLRKRKIEDAITAAAARESITLLATRTPWPSPVPPQSDGMAPPFTPRQAAGGR